MFQELSSTLVYLTMQTSDDPIGRVIHRVMPIDEDHLMLCVIRDKELESNIGLTKKLTINVLENNIPSEVLKLLEFSSSLLEFVPVITGDGYIMLKQYIVSFYTGVVERSILLNDHLMLIVKVVGYRKVNNHSPLLINHYQTQMYRKYRCKNCGYEFEGLLTNEYTCPQCHQGADSFEEVTEDPIMLGLLEAFKSECMAYMKYSFYASVAKKEGHQAIAKVLSEIADVEKEHAEIWYKELGDYPLNTKACLKEAANNEHLEWTKVYEALEAEASKLGYNDLANKYRMIRTVEKSHEHTFDEILEELNNYTRYSQKEDVVWVCSNCGYMHIAKDAPDKCPLCNHDQGYYTKMDDCK